jgi:hypothetical protein
MTRFRWFALAVSTATVAAVISFGASGLAATHRAHSNYPGPPQLAPAVKTVHGTNYRGPAQHMARISGTHRTNGPA